jgi:arylsulfatase A
MGWADLPVYGNRFNEAPNLTRMAAEGMRFSDAYATCPVCSPTRASIMSGQEERHQPRNQGFETANVYGGGGFFDYAEKMSSPIEEVSGRVLSKALTDLSLDFIESNKELPFFLYLSHFDVHVQLDADSALIQKYLRKEKVDTYPCNAVYAAMVEHVDNSVGRILDKLDQLGLSENTLVVYFSDNGGLVSRFDEIPLLAKS